MGVKQQVRDGITNQNSVKVFWLSCFLPQALCVTLSFVAHFSVQLTWAKGHFQTLLQFMKQPVLRVSYKPQVATVQSLI